MPLNQGQSTTYTLLGNGVSVGSFEASGGNPSIATVSPSFIPSAKEGGFAITGVGEGSTSFSFFWHFQNGSGSGACSVAVTVIGAPPPKQPSQPQERMHPPPEETSLPPQSKQPEQTTTPPEDKPASPPKVIQPRKNIFEDVIPKIPDYETPVIQQPPPFILAPPGSGTKGPERGSKPMIPKGLMDHIRSTPRQPPEKPIAPPKPPAIHTTVDAPPKSSKKEECICGPDITDELKKVIKAIEDYYNSASVEQQEKMCGNLIGLSGAGAAWDISELAKGWKKKGKQGCAIGKGCDDTVMVDGKCYYAGSVNYITFGTMFRVCDKWWLNTVMLNEAIDAWKRDIKEISLENVWKRITTEPAANTLQSKSWAFAGKGGWPKKRKTPAGRLDRVKKCEPCTKNGKIVKYNGHLSGHWGGGPKGGFTTKPKP